MTAQPTINSSLLLYQTEDGRTRVQCRFEGTLSNRHSPRADLQVA